MRKKEGNWDKGVCPVVTDGRNKFGGIIIFRGNNSGFQPLNNKIKDST